MSKEERYIWKNTLSFEKLWITHVAPRGRDCCLGETITLYILVMIFLEIVGFWHFYFGTLMAFPSCVAINAKGGDCWYFGMVLSLMSTPTKTLALWRSNNIHWQASNYCTVTSIWFTSRI